MSADTVIPTNLEARRDQGLLHVAWPDHEHDFSFVELRGSCECAHCVNEWTGERILDPATIPADISILSMDLVGAYAVRVRWSDGHDAGLFPWQRLRELAGLAAPP